MQRRILEDLNFVYPSKRNAYAYRGQERTPIHAWRTKNIETRRMLPLFDRQYLALSATVMPASINIYAYYYSAINVV